MNRQELKKLSKNQLKGHWKVPVLLTLLITFINGILYFIETDIYDTKGNILILSLLISILINAYINIWYHFFYLKFIKDNDSVSLDDIIILPKLLWKSVKTMFLLMVIFVPIIALLFAFITISIVFSSITLIILFTIILIIILLYIALSLFPLYYLLCEYEDINSFKGIKISFKLMKNHKLELFLLSLSFLGWTLIAIFTLSIGFLWLIPYINTTMANYYSYLKNNTSIKIKY